MMKPAKNAVIRARCSDDLKRQIEKIAEIQKIDPSDVIRIACDNHVAKIQAAMSGQVMLAA